MLIITTTLVVLAWDSWLIWPAIFAQGIVLVHHFSLQHECVHYTVFRTRRFNDIAGQICRILSDGERTFIPKEDYAAIYRDARVVLGAYAGLCAVMAITGWWGLIWLWIIPMFMGEPVMRFIRMTEHVGRPTVVQMHENTRTNLVSRPWRFLRWNMNYHAEHHYVSSVPFHALPKLHEKLKDHVCVEKGVSIGAHIDILRRIHAHKSFAKEA